MPCSGVSARMSVHPACALVRAHARASISYLPFRACVVFLCAESACVFALGAAFDNLQSNLECRLLCLGMVSFRFAVFRLSFLLTVDAE